MIETTTIRFQVRVSFRLWVPVGALREVVGEPVNMGWTRQGQDSGSACWTKEERELMAQLIFDLFCAVFTTHTPNHTWADMKATTVPTEQRQPYVEPHRLTVGWGP